MKTLHYTIVEYKPGKYLYLCYPTIDPNGDYIWDEWKWTLEEAEKRYPKDRWIWVKFED